MDATAAAATAVDAHHAVAAEPVVLALYGRELGVGPDPIETSLQGFRPLAALLEFRLVRLEVERRVVVTQLRVVGKAFGNSTAIGGLHGGPL